MDPRRARFLAALKGDAVDRPPLWLMRQAGRYLPDYRAVRAKHSFWEVCQTPELSTRVALEPLTRYPLDAAIVFSDILVVPLALGLDVTFGPGEGPRIGRPLRSKADLDAWTTSGVVDRLSFVPAAVSHLARTLAGSHGILGFSGAPFTLFSYCVEGGGSDDFALARTMLHRDPALAERALATLADVSAEYLEAQFQAGADIVQLFDTWGGLLDAQDYRRFCVPAIRRVVEPLKARGRSVLLFVRGGQHLLPVLGDTGVDGFSLDWRVDWAEARARYPTHVLQGNIDPILLLAGEAPVRERTRALMATMMGHQGGRRCIANLGHGIHKDTPPEVVSALCEEVVAAGARP